ncbi:MAG: hypothetical protein Lokiarch_45770 [Candidatus Lokiarchaeum sp. GC14_75]|nr:MAG: hypothetical protein Lokiarch_45770 [Candidatus Lokiarchaeum sp. GC14_75]
MDNLNKLRFNCTRCGNCCSDKNTLVNLTYSDILRISKSLRLDLKELIDVIGFFIFEKELSGNDLKKMVISPIKTEKGLAFVGLVKNKFGECYFYNRKNKECLIYNIRPMFCRTFPFSFNKSINENIRLEKEIHFFYTEKAKLYCQGIKGDKPIVNKENLLAFATKTLRELKENTIFNETWNKNVKIRHENSSVKKFLKLILQLENLNK